MIQPNVFKFPNWTGTWVHAMESQRSLYAKFAWINGATEKDYKWLAHPYRYSRERQQLDARLYRTLARDLHPPRGGLLERANFPLATCPVCLQAGYHTDVTQLLGYTECPFHGALLDRHCRNCFQPIKLGCPRYPLTGPFVCGHCGAPLTKFPENTYKTWRVPVIPDLDYQSRRMLARAKTMLREADGLWVFPSTTDSLDQSIVMNSMAKNHFAHFIAGGSGDLIGGTGNAESVVPVIVNLPAEEADLTAMGRQCLDQLVRHYAIDQDAGEWGLCTNVSKTKVYYSTDRPPWRNLLDATYTFTHDRRSRPLACFTEAISASINAMPQAASLNTMIAAAVVALSAPQVLRVILILHKLCKELEDTFDSDQPLDERQELLLATQRYQATLEFGRAGSKEFTFRVPDAAWLPPFRLRETEEGIELAVYQIWAARDCFEYAANDQ